MNEIDKAWKEHFELSDKLDAMKRREKAAKKKPDPYAYKKVRRELLPDNMHGLFVHLQCVENYVQRICSKYEEIADLLETATYIVDHGNVGGKRSRMTFPHDFQGAKQYFEYAKETYDWTELLMSVNIHYNEEYVKYKREQERLRKIVEQEKN